MEKIEARTTLQTAAAGETRSLEFADFFRCHTPCSRMLPQVRTSSALLTELHFRCYKLYLQEKEFYHLCFLTYTAVYSTSLVEIHVLFTAIQPVVCSQGQQGQHCQYGNFDRLPKLSNLKYETENRSRRTANWDLYCSYSIQTATIDQRTINSPEARPYRPFIPLIAYGVVRHCVRAPGQVDLACSG